MTKRATTIFSFGLIAMLAACGGLERPQLTEDDGTQDEDSIVGGAATTIEQNPWQISLQSSGGAASPFGWDDRRAFRAWYPVNTPVPRTPAARP